LPKRLKKESLRQLPFKKEVINMENKQSEKIRDPNWIKDIEIRFPETGGPDVAEKEISTEKPEVMRDPNWIKDVEIRFP
jgi:hypothetical protein